MANPTIDRTVPGLETDAAAEAVELLNGRLVALIDLGLTLKHVHWNVVGPNFIAIHEMLDDFVAKVRPMTDEVAERIRTLGGVSTGTPGYVVDQRDWDDYKLQQAGGRDHLEALDAVYDGVLADHRSVIAKVADLDPVTEDLLIAQAGELELMQWFIRSFLRGWDA